MAIIISIGGTKLPPGTYNAIVTSVEELTDVLKINMTSVESDKILCIDSISRICAPPPDAKPIIKAEDSWQSMNKGKFSKRQRRK